MRDRVNNVKSIDVVEHWSEQVQIYSENNGNEAINITMAGSAKDPDIVSKPEIALYDITSPSDSEMTFTGSPTRVESGAYGVANPKGHPVDDKLPEVSKILADYDKNKVDKMNEDINALLTFAGLFSAVATTFIVLVYQGLFPDSTMVTTDLLLHISQQLASAQPSPKVSLPPAVLPTFHRSPVTTKTITLWLLSLVFSLITVSLGVYVKQWLREYLTYVGISPKAHIRVRDIRHQGLEIYHVEGIVSALPMLLQFAQGMFFLGLAIFSIDLNYTIGVIITPFLILWASFMSVTFMLPAFSVYCPYKTPSLKSLLWGLRYAYFFLHRFLGEWRRSYKSRWRSGRFSHFARNIYKSWAETRKSWRHVAADIIFSAPLDDTFARNKIDVDLDALTRADKIFVDDEFLSPVLQCLLNKEIIVSEAEGYKFIVSIVQHRANIPNIHNMSQALEYLQSKFSHNLVSDGNYFKIQDLVSLTFHCGEDHYPSWERNPSNDVFPILDFITTVRRGTSTAETHRARDRDVGKRLAKTIVMFGMVKFHYAIHVIRKRLYVPGDNSNSPNLPNILCDEFVETFFMHLQTASEEYFYRKREDFLQLVLSSSSQEEQFEYGRLEEYSVDGVNGYSVALYTIIYCVLRIMSTETSEVIINSKRIGSCFIQWQSSILNLRCKVLSKPNQILPCIVPLGLESMCMEIQKMLESSQLSRWHYDPEFLSVLKHEVRYLVRERRKRNGRR